MNKITEVKKKIILSEIQAGVFNNYVVNYLFDDDIALGVINLNIENLALVERYHSDKKVLTDLVKKGKLEALIYMTSDCKGDVEFAKELYEINLKSIPYFFEKVQYNDFFLEKARKDLGNHILYAPYFYENEQEIFYESLKKTPKIYDQLTLKMRRNKDIILTTLRSPDAHQYSVDYIGLPDDLKNDFQIVTAMLKLLREGVIYYKTTVSKIKPHIINDEGLKNFMDNYEGKYTKDIMNALKKNKQFKKKFEHLLVEYPNIKDYGPYMREVLLKEKIKEQPEKDVVRIRAKI